MNVKLFWIIKYFQYLCETIKQNEMENFTTLEINSITNAAFDMLAKSLQTQANLQSNLGNYELANQLQEQSNKVMVMNYHITTLIKNK